MKASVICIALVVSALPAHSDILWTRDISLDSHSSGISTQERFRFWSLSGGYSLFDAVSFSTEDIGRTFTISSPTDDGDFTAAVRSLTDGNNDEILLLKGTSILSGPVYTESILFSTVPRLGIDLVGYRIDAIHLTIDELWIGRDYLANSDPSSPWTDTYGSATLSIEGAVIPEPSAAIGVVGLAVLGVVRARRCANHSLEGTCYPAGQRS